jgi:UDP-N-acetylmuramate dehydrogenase
LGRYGIFLAELLPTIPFEKDFSFAAHTSIGTGGRASAFFPRTVKELTTLSGVLERCSLPYFVLGGGSNILPPDGDYEHTVIVPKAFDGVVCEGECLTAECGVTAGKILAVCEEKGLSGLEFLAGIPAQAGGLVCMNAGTPAGHVGDVAESVTFLRGKKFVTYAKEQCAFGEKESVFGHERAIILSVRFRLRRTTSEKVREEIARMAKMRSGQPKGKSMGCVFQNPYPSLSAGALIDACGCKGWRQGGAVVSARHANFILNENNATSADIKTLIGRVKNHVYQTTGILLREEIRYL